MILMRHALSQIGICLLTCGLIWLMSAVPVQAGAIDPFVLRFLDAKEPVSLPVNMQGQMQSFSGVDLSEGKRLFEENCKNCHVGGTTLPNPTVPLSLDALAGAIPPRDTIDSLVTFLRQPMSYDNTEEAYLCRQVPETWMPQAEIEKLVAFVLRSAQKAPGWGSTSF